MECTGEDWACLIGLFFENDVVRDKITELLGFVVSGSGWNTITDWIKQYGQVTIGLLGFSFGVWRWYVSREAGLHRRLLRYISENRLKLDTGIDATLEALNSPASLELPKAPLFAVKPLQQLLKRKNWAPSLVFTGHPSRADDKLGRALKLIENRIDIADRAVVSLRRQQAGAHIIKGAIASAQAANRKHERSRIALDHRALDAFRTARQVPGHDDDIRSLEFQAHQLMKLGLLDPAEGVLEHTIRVAATIENARDRDFTIARAKSRQAQIHQARAEVSGSMTANSLVRKASDSALALRRRHEPMSGWDLIEQGRIKLFAALAANRIAATVIEADCLRDAEQNFLSAEQQSSSFFRGTAMKRLNQAAKAGLQQVQRARGKDGYDDAELLPPKTPVTIDGTSLPDDAK